MPEDRAERDERERQRAQQTDQLARLRAGVEDLQRRLRDTPPFGRSNLAEYARGLIHAAEAIAALGHRAQLEAPQPDGDDAKADALEILRWAGSPEQRSQVEARLQELLGSGLESRAIAVDQWLRRGLLREIFADVLGEPRPPADAWDVLLAECDRAPTILDMVHSQGGRDACMTELWDHAWDTGRVVNPPDPQEPPCGQSKHAMLSAIARLRAWAERERSAARRMVGRPIAEMVEVRRGAEVMGRIGRTLPLPGTPPEQARRDQLECARAAIEQWRAHLTDNPVDAMQATRLAYLTNAHERELWSETESLGESRTFIRTDALALVERVRGRILAALEGRPRQPEEAAGASTPPAAGQTDVSTPASPATAPASEGAAVPPLVVSLPAVFAAAAEYALAIWDNRPPLPGGPGSFDSVPAWCRPIEAAYSHLSDALKRPDYTEAAWQTAADAAYLPASAREGLKQLYQAIGWERQRESPGRRLPESLAAAFRLFKSGIRGVYLALAEGERQACAHVLAAIRQRWEPDFPTGADVPAEPGTPLAAAPSEGAGKADDGPPIPADEANELARAYIQQREGAGENVTARQLAKHIRIALSRVPGLPAWRAYQARKQQTPQAGKPKPPRQLTRPMLRAIGQKDDPGAALADAEEAAWRHLVESATPDERSGLNAMTPAEKAEAIRLVLDQWADQDKRGGRENA